MSLILECSRCGRPEYKPDDVVSFVCGSCTIVRASCVQKKEEERLSDYTPEDSKVARKKKRWTQKSLAFKLGIPVGHVSEFERGATLIDPKHAEWLDKQ